MTYHECKEKLKTFGIPPRAWGYVRDERREEYLAQLIEIVEVTNNPQAFGYIHFIKSGKYYDAGDFNRGYEEAEKALSYGDSCDDWWITAMALNNIGVFHGQQDNIITAFDYYWRAINRINDAGENDAPLLYLLYGNVGECMGNVHEYEKALKYYLLLEQFDVPENFVHVPMNNAFTNMCKVECYYMLNRYKEAFTCIADEEILESQHEETKFLHYSMLVWKYILSYTSISENKNELEEIRQELLQFNIMSVCFPSLKILCAFLLEQKEYDFFKRALSFLEKKAREEGNVALELSAVHLWIIYYQENGEIEAYQERCALFYELQQKREQQEFTVRSQSLNTLVAVAERSEQQREMERMQELLRKKSEIDELTGLPNRYRLKDFCALAFAEAIQKKQNISVEILDIDCFKQLNDHYGHPDGDKCLKAIGAEITKTLGEHDLGARYGGDEFVIIRQGRSDDEINERMKTLKENIIKLGIPNILSTAAPVATVSQGAVNAIPGEEDDLSEFLKMADQALYRSKRTEKNSYLLYKE